jgi:F0F1-type ATP synthase membrane subunit b/b'
MTLIKTILILALPSLAIASSGGDSTHTPNIMDLVFPAINFCIVFGFIIIKIKKPVSAAFTKNSEDVEALYSLADEKYKEAQIQYESFSKKLEQLDQETTKINESSLNNVKNYSIFAKEETAQTVERMERDAQNKFESDKNQVITKLNCKLLDKVIDQAKKTILDNKENQSKATSKLISSLS